MALRFEDYPFGKNPALYGQDLARSLNIKEPPVDEERVADFLGYEIIHANPQNYPKHLPFIGDIFRQSPSHLFKELNVILVNDEIPKLRQRLSIFHEYGHDIYPLHHGLNFACSSIELDIHKKIEREAFQAGGEIIMPRHLFVPDMRDLPLGISSIRRLANRYKASMEATAIRYAEISHMKCAVIVTEPLKNKQNHLVHEHFINPCNPDQLQLPLNIEKDTLIKSTEEDGSLTIKYIVPSPKLQQHYKTLKTYMRRGAKLSEESIFYQALETGQFVRGEVLASVFGSSRKFTYLAECEPLRKDGSLLILMWLEDPQLVLSFNN